MLISQLSHYWIFFKVNSLAIPRLHAVHKVDFKKSVLSILINFLSVKAQGRGHQMHCTTGDIHKEIRVLDKVRH